MKISVIIPALNEERLLPGLLTQLSDAALRECYPIEVILADGGSTDKTVQLSIPFVDVIVTQTERETRNISSGRNLGAKMSEGDVLVFLNADVLLDDAVIFFEYIVKKFWISEAVAMTCKVHTFKEERELRDILFHSFYNTYFQLLNLCGIGMGRGECHVIKRHYFELTGGYRTDLPAGEDFDLFRKLKSAGRITFARELVVLESPRRYRKYGYLKVAWSWTVNAFSILTKNKSHSTAWEEVR